MVTGIGVIEGVECMITANDPSVKGGASNPWTVRKIFRASQIAEENGLPTVALDVLLTAAGHGLGVLGLEVGELLQHRLSVRDVRGHFSTTAFIRSSVVRMPFSLVRPRSAPSSVQ